MRVLFVTKYYPPSEGGIERYSQVLCTRLQSMGVSIQVLAAAESGQPSITEYVDGVAVTRVASLGEAWGVELTPALPAVMKRLARSSDLIHLNFPNPVGEIAYTIAGRGLPVVMTYHCDVYRQRLATRLYDPFARWLLARMDAVVATSPHYVDSSKLLSANAERCEVIPLPVDVEWLSAGATETAAHEYGRCVLFVGRLVYYKGIEYLIDAMAEVLNVSLVIVGRGRLAQELKNRARASSAPDRIHFTGKVSEEQLRTLYHTCECLVLPSVARAEAFGSVLIEAMACGKPVISTELGTGTSWVNRDGETGFVVPPRNPSALAAAIRRIVQDDDLRRRLGDNARSWIQQFDCGRVAEKTLSVYQNVLEARRTTQP
jgi:glycosyltransferase involved in cell wall biosynthesis